MYIYIDIYIYITSYDYDKSFRKVAQLCSPTAGSRVTRLQCHQARFQGFVGFHDSTIAGCQGCKVADFESSKVPRFQSSRLPGFWGSKFPGFKVPNIKVLV